MLLIGLYNAKDERPRNENANNLITFKNPIKKPTNLEFIE